MAANKTNEKTSIFAQKTSGKTIDLSLVCQTEPAWPPSLKTNEKTSIFARKTSGKTIVFFSTSKKLPS